MLVCLLPNNAPFQVGFESFGTDLPEDVSEAEVLKVVADYNADPKVCVTAAAAAAGNTAA